jgi:hypothetical protein
MKKRLFVSLVLLTIVTVSVVFAQAAPTSSSIVVSTKEAGELFLQGQSIAALWDNETYTIPIERPGVYTLQLKLVTGFSKTSSVSITDRGIVANVDFSTIPIDNTPINNRTRAANITATTSGSAVTMDGPANESALWYNSYAPGFENNLIFINAGIGIGVYEYDMGIPPISLSADIKIPVTGPITIGPVAIFSTWKFSKLLTTGNSIIDSMAPRISGTFTNIGFGARFMYHFNFMRNWDTYTGLTLGYVAQTARVDATIGMTSGSGIEAKSFFLFGVNIGARYFFTDLIGVYGEIGYSGLQYVGGGLSIKI